MPNLIFRKDNTLLELYSPAMLDGLTTEQLNEVITSIPLKRIGKTVELAGTCLFLASDLSGFITGATIDVNGGIHIH